MDPTFLPAWRLAELTRKREIGCLELLDHYIGRVERLDSRINAVVVRDFARARARARTLDAQTDRAAPFFGVPMTVKESFDIKGHPTTWGYEERREHRAEEDALAVERIEAAGAVVFGKTNVPVGLADWQSYNPVYGATSNPWNVAHTPGGSSGGGAAVVAAGLSGLEIGTDIGGSVRVPAHFCGIFGHKPSWGLCSVRGHSLTSAAAMTDISVLGPLARSARDLRLALDALAGHDPRESGATMNLPPPRAQTMRDLRVAVWTDQPGEATSRETTAAIETLAAELERAGATVDRSVRPDFDAREAYHLYLTLLDAALSARAPEDVLARKRERKAGQKRDANTADDVIDRAVDLSHREWLQLNERRHQVRRAWAAFFRDWHVLLCPTLGVPALPHMQEGATRQRTYTVDGRTIAYNDLLFWPGITCGYHLPASVAPIGISGDGLPIGVQIVGNLHDDHTTIRVAELMEEAGHAFVAPPGWT